MNNMVKLTIGILFVMAASLIATCAAQEPSIITETSAAPTEDISYPTVETKQVDIEANVPKFVGPVDIGGTWNLYVENEFVGTGQIIQDGGSLTFINHNGQQSSGRFIDSNTVEATDWEDGLRGTLTSDGNRIDWETSLPSSWTRD